MSNQIMVIERVGDVDLLQQALANAGEDLIINQTQTQVMDQTELLNILQGDSSDSQTIQITAEEAAALGLRLETDLVENTEKSEVIFDQTFPNVVYDPNTKTRIVYRTVFPEELDLQTPKRVCQVKRGRPKKTEEKRPQTPEPEIPVAKPIRTRSGRLTKPPRHKHYRPLREIDIENKTEEPTPIISIKEEPIRPQPIITKPSQKRFVASQIRCTTCNKAYLGRSRLERHLRLFPDHGPPRMQSNTKTLWDTAIKTVSKVPVGNRGIKLLKDVQSLIDNLLKIKSDLLRPVDEKPIKFEVDENLSHILRISPGSYSINDDALDSLNKKDLESELNLDDEVIESTDDMMSVDQLVNERLYSLTAGELSVPIDSTDQISIPNESTALNIDLSLDLFQFNPS